ncbi:MAG: peptidoglycan DD-metalloendopeptidase family protein [Bacteroidia bacterium]
MKGQVVNRANAFLFICWATFLPLSAIAQDFAPEREDIQHQLRLTDQLLNETAGNREKTVTELQLLNEQIRLRERLIDILGEEVIAQETEIERLNDMICQMEADIEKIFENYAKTAHITYKSFDKDNFFLAILTSGSISEAYYRAQYFQQFSRYRQQQIDMIKQAQRFLSNKGTELHESILANERLMDEKQMEIARLHFAKGKQTDYYAAVRPRERNYRKSASQQQSNLKSQIRKNETGTNIQQAAFVAESTAKTELDYARTFVKSKGSLVWPVPSDKGIVIGKFGKSEDPFGNQIQNEGIYIRTPKGQHVRSVYMGVVTGVKQLPMNGGVMVIIEHGQYRTVYANLEESFVTEGQKINANDEIGMVKTDKRSGETILNFLIYKEPDTFMDPERWMISQ